MRPVTVEIIAYAPTEFFHCLHCELVWRESGVGPRIHAEQRAAALPPELAQEYVRVGGWAQQIAERFGGRVHLKVVDVASPEGLFKVLRYRVRRFPAFVVDGRETFIGADLARITAAIERRLGLAAIAEARPAGSEASEGRAPRVLSGSNQGGRRRLKVEWLAGEG